jgi:ATP dependent DNA ligase C terminal region
MPIAWHLWQRVKIMPSIAGADHARKLAEQREGPTGQAAVDRFKPARTFGQAAPRSACGRVDPRTAFPSEIGSLVVGYYDHGKLRFAGGVGTGYTARMRRDLLAKLRPLSRDAPPFAEIPRAVAAAIVANRAVQSRPRRVSIVTLPAARRTAMR